MYFLQAADIWASQLNSHSDFHFSVHTFFPFFRFYIPRNFLLSSIYSAFSFPLSIFKIHCFAGTFLISLGTYIFIDETTSSSRVYTFFYTTCYARHFNATRSRFAFENEMRNNELHILEIVKLDNKKKNEDLSRSKVMFTLTEIEELKEQI